MNIFIKKNFKKLLSPDILRRKYGKMGDMVLSLIKLIKQSSPENLFSLPGRPHKLSSMPEGTIAFTLKHPYRLIAHIDWDRSLVTIQGVMDYHGHHKSLKQISA